MAQAIPRASWSEAEAQRERQFNWQYLVNRWLVPGPAVLTEPDEAPSERFRPPTAETLLENGWLLERRTTCEQ
jgi:hypothetical protein